MPNVWLDPDMDSYRDCLEPGAKYVRAECCEHRIPALHPSIGQNSLTTVPLQSSAPATKQTLLSPVRCGSGDSRCHSPRFDFPPSSSQPAQDARSAKPELVRIARR